MSVRRTRNFRLGQTAWIIWRIRTWLFAYTFKSTSPFSTPHFHTLQTRAESSWPILWLHWQIPRHHLKQLKTEFKRNLISVLRYIINSCIKTMFSILFIYLPQIGSILIIQQVFWPELLYRISYRYYSLMKRNDITRTRYIILTPINPTFI